MKRYTITLLLLDLTLATFLCVQSLPLNSDGVSLLAFRYAVISDPFSVLQGWRYGDETPCNWRGVSCETRNGVSRVVSLSLPSSKLAGAIPSEIGSIEFLRRLDLSNNSLNCSLPVSPFRNAQLAFLDLSNNWISGEIPELIPGTTNFETLNLSDNALSGKIPSNIGALPNLTVLSLKNNYLSGELPGGFLTVQSLDLSSNLINGSLRSDFSGESLAYFNASHNRISGAIPPDFAERIPETAVVDLSFNRLEGPVPVAGTLANQPPESFSGNPGLWEAAAPTSPPAIAAIPKTIDSDPARMTPGSNDPPKGKRSGLEPRTIVAIVAGDAAGIVIIALIFFYLYRFRRTRKSDSTTKSDRHVAREDWSPSSSVTLESKGVSRWSCMTKKVDENESSTSESDSDDEERAIDHPESNQAQKEHEHRKPGTLVTFDGDKELELETLLKASAYILGATSSSIMYKAVLDDGAALAVRRIGESGVDRFKDFENRVRVVAKLAHPNLVRVRGFYWGVDEKLIIYDYVPNGSLANARYRKVGSSPCPLPWEARLKIARGVARGLAYLHEKKHVHGNLKPSNVLLGPDMEPKIGNFGLERLVTGDTSAKTWGSARTFGSKRSNASRDSFPDFAGLGPGPSPSPSAFAVSPYLAPESLRSLKPGPRWDVFSFGVVFLELLTGKVVVLDESGPGPTVAADDPVRALRMADPAIRADLEGKEEALLACFKVGYSCASPAPQKRPTMREVLQVLEKFPSSPSSPYGYYGQ